MRARFLLLALWLLSLLLPAPRLWAQGRLPGPWRLTYQMEQRWVQGPDTITKERVLKWMPDWLYYKVRWDVVPDSVRLFRNCENPLIAPSQPRNGQPGIRFSATGATVRLGAESRQLFVAPFDSVVTLWAYRGKALLFKHVFKTVPPPLPSLECWCSLTPTFGLTGREIPPSFCVKAIPTSEFASMMSDDARYRVSRRQVTLVRNGSPVHAPILIDWKPMDADVLKQLKQLAQSGDQFKIDVQLIERQNFCGDIEVVPLTRQFMVPVF